MKRWHVVGIGAVSVAVLAVMVLVITATNKAPAPIESPRFQPLSASFASAEEGWVLGAIEPCDSGRPCQRIEHTTDGGRTWQALPSTIPQGAWTIRFATAAEGWVTAQGVLWWTSDGGADWEIADWAGVTLGRNTSLSGDSVRFVNGSRSGRLELSIGRMGGAADEASSFRTDGDYLADPVVESVTRDDTTWVWTYGEQRGPGGAATPVSAGAKIVGEQWFPWRTPCNAADEYLSALQAPTTDRVVALCAPRATASGYRQPRLLVSADGGETFAVRDIPAATLTTLLASAQDTIVLGMDGAIHASFDGGRQWTRTYSPPESGGYTNFGSLGRTDHDNGPGFVTASTGFTFRTTRFPADNIHAYRSEKTLLVTRDGGHSWSPVDFGSR